MSHDFHCRSNRALRGAEAVLQAVHKKFAADEEGGPGPGDTPSG